MNDISVRRWLNVLCSGAFDFGVPQARSLCLKLGKQFHYELGTALLCHFFFGPLKKDETCLDDLLAAFDEISERSQTASFVATMLDRHKLLKLEKPETADRLTRERLVELDRKLVVPDSWLGLEIAKLCALHEPQEAKKELRKALGLFPPYSFYLKSQGLVSSVLNAPNVTFKTEIRFAVVGSATTRLLVPVLKAAGLAMDMRLEVYEGDFGNYAQDILDPDSGLYRFQPDVLLFLLESHDFPVEPALCPDQSLDYVKRIRHLWDVVQSRTTCHIIQTGLEYPQINSWGTLEDTLENGRRRQIDSVNRHLSDALPKRVSFLNVNSLAALTDSPWISLRDWYMFKQYPAPAVMPVFADAILAQTAAVFGVNKKVLVLDLDNTCWNGVIGEDGLEGIHLGNSSSALGKSCLELQKYARELKERGILLAVCSKNNERDALLPFECHDEMILKKDDFVAFRADWNDKASNIRSIAAELNLGLDSFVFLDDNPVERDLVRREIPEVAVPEFGSSHEKMLFSLQRGMYFETVCLTDEDRKRHQCYRLRGQSVPSDGHTTDLNAYLGKLQMKCSHGPVDESSLSRVHQLVTKTNQFNLTSYRHTREQIRAMAKSPDWWCHWFRLTDRQIDHGIIGVLFVRKQQDVWFVDTWLMSCRVIGRRLEHFMFKILIQTAMSDHCSKIYGEYVPSDKNTQVGSLYPQLGFSRCEKTDFFVIHTDQASAPDVPIQDKKNAVAQTSIVGPRAEIIDVST